MRISFAGAGPLQINDGISTIGRVMEKMKSNAKRA